jgi:hypothetical protein
VEDEFDLVSALASCVGDRRSTWAFVRGFAASWLGRPLGAGDGLDDAELAAVREGLRARHPTISKLPAALVETYALAGHRRDLTSNQDQLLSGGQLRPDDSGQVLVVRAECQGCAQWGIRLGDLDQDDPPMVMRIADDPRGWIPYAPRWSVAFLEIVLCESLFCDEVLAWNTELDDEAVGLIEARYGRLPMPDLPHWILPQVRWFAGPDVLLRDEAQTWLWARARTPAALDALRTTLGRR